jgi:hypothetical protein
VNIDLSKYMRDSDEQKPKAAVRELVLFNKWGKATLRLRDKVLYDYKGRPRGFIVGTTVYDIRCEHRGFWRNLLMSDRMHRVIGYAHGASIQGLVLPPVEFPPLVYRDDPPPPVPGELIELECPPFVAVWSMMQFENLLPSFDEEEVKKVEEDDDL